MNELTLIENNETWAVIRKKINDLISVVNSGPTHFLPADSTINAILVITNDNRIKQISLTDLVIEVYGNIKAAEKKNAGGLEYMHLPQVYTDAALDDKGLYDAFVERGWITPVELGTVAVSSTTLATVTVDVPFTNAGGFDIDDLEVEVSANSSFSESAKYTYKAKSGSIISGTAAQGTARVTVPVTDVIEHPNAQTVYVRAKWSFETSSAASGTIKHAPVLGHVMIETKYDEKEESGGSLIARLTVTDIDGILAGSTASLFFEGKTVNSIGLGISADYNDGVFTTHEIGIREGVFDVYGRVTIEGIEYISTTITYTEDAANVEEVAYDDKSLQATAYYSNSNEVDVFDFDWYDDTDASNVHTISAVGESGEMTAELTLSTGSYHLRARVANDNCLWTTAWVAVTVS